MHEQIQTVYCDSPLMFPTNTQRRTVVQRRIVILKMPQTDLQSDHALLFV